MKATYKNFPVVLLIYYAYNEVLTFESVDQILKRDHSNESHNISQEIHGLSLADLQWCHGHCALCIRLFFDLKILLL